MAGARTKWSDNYLKHKNPHIWSDFDVVVVNWILGVIRYTGLRSHCIAILCHSSPNPMLRLYSPRMT